MIRLYFQQALYHLRENPIITWVSVLGTALAICMIMVLVITFQVRLVDCVGFLVDGASGYLEDGGKRMVKTPWFPEEIPFEEAAAFGTQKVIKEHATIGIVVTTDGTIGELLRED